MTKRATNPKRTNGTSWQRSGVGAVAVAAIVASLLGSTEASDSAVSDAPAFASAEVDFSSACWDDNCGEITAGYDKWSTEETATEQVLDVVVPISEPIAIEAAEDVAPVLEIVKPVGKGTNLSEVNTMADSFAAMGWTGAGVDVAVIDSGVSPVHGLDQDGQILYGPDLSLDFGTANENLDMYGHGSHIAGIIAGRADDMTGGAPDARLVSIKVAGADGETSVPQIIAAIDWVIANKQANGLNIRVLNLSFGLDREGDSGTDPLMAAVDRAWDAGIVVVAAAGNRGSQYGAIDSPAAAPQIIAVGSTNPGPKSGVATEQVSTWSNSGDNVRNPDLVVPGKSLLSARVPGSTLDKKYPQARWGELFKGSGTSQSSAVVAGWAAAIVSGNPHLSPDQVKYALLKSTVDIATGSTLDGYGRLDPGAVTRPVRWAYRTRFSQNFGQQPWFLDGRFVDSAELSALFSGGSWAGGSWAGGSWAGGSWAGGSWAGGSWAGGSWAGGSWAGGSWAGGSWAGGSWGQS